MEINNVIGKIPHSGKKWSQRKAGAVKIIAVHHAAGNILPDNYDEVSVISGMAKYHMNKNWGSQSAPAYAPTITYHFSIARSGAVYQHNNIEDVTWHARNANPLAIGVLLHGNLDKQKPSAAQLKSLNELLKAFNSGFMGVKVGKSDVYGHGELKGKTLSLKYGKFTDFGNYTVCPGSVLSYVQEFRAKGFISEVQEEKPQIPDHVGEFMDLPKGEWYTIFAETLIDAGVMRGYEDKTWRPAEPLTRAEIAKVIVGAILKAEEIKSIYKEKNK